MQSATQEAGKAWNQVVNFVTKAEVEAKTVAADALNTTSTFTTWLAEKANKI